MMNTNLTRTSVFGLLISWLLLGLGGCTQNTPDPVGESPSENVVMNDMVEKLIANGYELERIQEYMDFYLVEDDLTFSKDMELNAPDDNLRNYHSNLLVSSDYIGNGNVIWVFSTLPGATGFGNIGTTWDEAVGSAMAAWNGIPNACINFQRTLTPSQAHITVINGEAKPLAQNHFGWAGQPLPSGAPFHTVWINMQYPIGPASLNGAIANTSFYQKRNIIAHELGHCIGFMHTDVLSANPIPGTGATDPNSLMRDNLDFQHNMTAFSVFDEIAVRWLYGTGSCVRTDPPPPSAWITLDLITPFCFPATFNASGTYKGATRGVTTIELQVMEVTGGPGFWQTIAVGQFTGGTYSFANLDLGNIAGFTFNPNSSYNIRAVITNPGSAVSASQSLVFDDCSNDPCQGQCEAISGAIQVQNNGFYSYTFSIAQSILNDPCAASFTYEWQHSQTIGNGTGSSYTLSLPFGANTVALYINYNGTHCHKETIHLNI